MIKTWTHSRLQKHSSQGEQEGCHLPWQPLSAIFRHFLKWPLAWVQANAGHLLPRKLRRPCPEAGCSGSTLSQSLPCLETWCKHQKYMTGKRFHSLYSTHLQIIRIFGKKRTMTTFLEAHVSRLIEYQLLMTLRGLHVTLNSQQPKYSECTYREACWTSFPKANCHFLSLVTHKAMLCPFIKFKFHNSRAKKVKWTLNSICNIPNPSSNPPLWEQRRLHTVAR